MYQLCVQAGRCSSPARSDFYGLFDYYSDPAYGNFPVVYVSLAYANSYCSWAGRRLPTSAEWEAAARGGDGRIYPWGNNPPDGNLANICDTNCTLPELADKRNDAINDGYAYTSPVGSFWSGASPYGVLDMAGNVWEWTSTAHGGYYVIRGGAWTSNSETSKSTFENTYDQNMMWVDTGFRCAANP